MMDDDTAPGTTPPDPPQSSGLQGFVASRPMLSGFLTFLVIQFGGGAITWLFAMVASAFDEPRFALGIGGLLITLALYIGLGIWGFRLGGGRFLAGLLLPIGVIVLLVGACFAIFAMSFSGA